MKFSSALITIALAAFVSATAAEELTLYRGSDISGVTSYQEAVAFCESNGKKILATKDEWKVYATSRTGTIYGLTAFRDDTSGFVDVEAAFGIPKPTDPPLRIVRTRGQISGGFRERRQLKVTAPDSILCAEAPVALLSTNVGSGSGDPHFKTWTGDKYDYHGECDLVLVHNPSFANGKGLRVHIRTTRVKYFSYIERVAIQIGDDVLEFDNDVENFRINGNSVEPNAPRHRTMFAGYLVRRDKKAISIRLDEAAKAKIDLIQRENGFPAVIVDGGTTDIFKGSLGLLGEWSTGTKLARNGETEIVTHHEEGATAFALEWQVRDNEPMLFSSARFPQYPATCVPPAKVMGNRLGKSHMEEVAEKVCAHWKEDKEDCIFDVIATRDVLVATEGNVHESVHESVAEEK